ncbi:MAG: hypothetical protein E7320_02190 [Clostridiales bacterium]|nr:hypothetical protein [Clostridiales bacterium]
MIFDSLAQPFGGSTDSYSFLFGALIKLFTVLNRVIAPRIRRIYKDDEWVDLSLVFRDLYADVGIGVLDIGGETAFALHSDLEIIFLCQKRKLFFHAPVRRHKAHNAASLLLLRSDKPGVLPYCRVC